MKEFSKELKSNFTKYLFVIFIILITNFSFAQSYTYSFLRYNSSARASAMGSAYESINNETSAIFLNPATLNTINDKRFSVTYLKHVLDINSGNIVYVKSTPDIGSFAASAIYSNYGSFTSYDNQGRETGNFGANNLAIGFSYGNELDTNLYYGATVKFIYSHIEKYASSALGLDFGLLYNLDDGRTSIAASILNVGFQLASYNGETETLPVDIRIGANHRLMGLPLLASLSFHHLADTAPDFFSKFSSFSIGGEFYIGKYVNLRLGFDNNIRRFTTPASERKLSGFSAGIGIKTTYFNFDYSLAQIGTSNLLNRFSINLDF